MKSNPGGVPTKKRTKSPSKLRRLERRAEQRAAGVVPERRSFFSMKVDPQHLTKAQKQRAALQALAEAAAANKVSLDDMTLAQLKNLAADRDIAGRSKMNKQQLIEALS